MDCKVQHNDDFPTFGLNLRIISLDFSIIDLEMVGYVTVLLCRSITRFAILYYALFSSDKHVTPPTPFLSFTLGSPIQYFASTSNTTVKSGYSSVWESEWLPKEEKWQSIDSTEHSDEVQRKPRRRSS